MPSIPTGPRFWGFDPRLAQQTRIVTPLPAGATQQQLRARIKRIDKMPYEHWDALPHDVQDWYNKAVDRLNSARRSTRDQVVLAPYPHKQT